MFKLISKIYKKFFKKEEIKKISTIDIINHDLFNRLQPDRKIDTEYNEEFFPKKQKEVVKKEDKPKTDKPKSKKPKAAAKKEISISKEDKPKRKYNRKKNA